MSEKARRQLEFLIQIAYAAVIILLVYLACVYLVDWLLPFLLAFCMVALLHPVIRRLRKMLHIRHEVLSVTVVILLYCAVGTLIFFGVLQLVLWIQDALGMLDVYYADAILPTLTSLGDEFARLFHRLPEAWQVQLAGFQETALAGLQSFLLGLSQRGLTALGGLTAKIPAFLIGLGFTVMLSLFISAQYARVTVFLKHQLPPRAQKIAEDLRVIVVDTVLKYLKAVFTLMVITFIELSIGLMVLGAGNSLAISAGIAIFDALPFFGTGAIMIPWFIIELIQGNYTFALGLGVLYAIITVVRNLIEPKIVGDKLGINPIVSLVSIYFGFRLLGVLGMIVMPMVAQIVLALHKRGTIRLFRDPPGAEGAPAEKPTPDTMQDG